MKNHLDIKPTNEVRKAIQKYGLLKIHTGSLSRVPNDRYIRVNEMCFDKQELVTKYGLDLNSENFVMVLNHFEQYEACWTVWETPYVDFETINKIYQAEHWRRLWDSSQLYYDDGCKLVLISISKE